MVVLEKIRSMRFGQFEGSENLMQYYALNIFPRLNAAISIQWGCLEINLCYPKVCDMI